MSIPRGSRKIIAGLVLLIVGLGITIARGDIPPNFLSLLQALYMTFIIGNGTEYVSSAFLAKKENKDE